MSKGSSSSDNGEAAKAALLELREAFLELHKILLQSERIGYEQTFGTIGSPGEFLQLAIKDPWFAWLRPLSELIASIDERIESDEPISEANVRDFKSQVRALLTPQEVGEGFAKHYFDALQRDPDVVLAHGRISKLKK